MYHMAPTAPVAPPEVSEARLDASAQDKVDIRKSMMSMRPLPPPDSQARPATPERPSKKNVDPTAALAALKARLESDGRPRYTVDKDHMDHGPFSAVELLQQIASHSFRGEHTLRDEIGGQSMPISDWEEFAPFAEQARLMREHKAEQRAVAFAVKADKKSGIAKSVVAGVLVCAIVGGLAVWFLKRRGTRSDEVAVSKDRMGNVDVNGDIKGQKRAVAASGGHGGGGYYGGGQSYEAVLNSNNETISMGAQGGEPDLTNAQLSAPLRHTAFISACGAPDSMGVTIRVAVKMGVPIGVTVSTNPPNGAVAGCIDHNVRGLRWPQNPKTDFVTTSY
jgi:hypothetical protein